MVHSFEINGYYGVYDSVSGFSERISELMHDMIGFLEGEPASEGCPTSLRYSLAKYESGEVSAAYAALRAHYLEGRLFVKAAAAEKNKAAADGGDADEEKLLELRRKLRADMKAFRAGDVSAAEDGYFALSSVPSDRNCPECAGCWAAKLCAREKAGADCLIERTRCEAALLLRLLAEERFSL